MPPMLRGRRRARGPGPEPPAPPAFRPRGIGPSSHPNIPPTDVGDPLTGYASIVSATLDDLTVALLPSGMRGTTANAVRRQLFVNPLEDRSGLRSRMEGATLQDRSVLQELQRLVRERGVDEPPRRSWLRRR